MKGCELRARRRAPARTKRCQPQNVCRRGLLPGAVQAERRMNDVTASHEARNGAADMLLFVDRLLAFAPHRIPDGSQARSGSLLLTGRSQMKKMLLLGTLLACGFATAATAGVFPMQRSNTSSLVITVAEGCGPGWWRGPGGRCHPMYNGRACPRGYHLGPEHRRCWPN